MKQVKALKMHEEMRGKIEIRSKVRLSNHEDLSIFYTPGVAEPCRKIKENKNDVYRYTARGNLVAVVSDGTAVLGLGNVGPEAAMPVMEGKAILFKEFAGIDAFPLCLATTEIDEIVKTIKHVSPTFGAINLEDISSPRCFAIENRLKQELDIPVFHDDQHGTAIVTLAGLINALKLTGRSFGESSIVLNGAGAAGTAVAKILLDIGVQDLIICDRNGILDCQKRDLLEHKQYLAAISNRRGKRGLLRDAIKGADVFIGVSAPSVLDENMVRSMNKDAIIFALANPVPEIMPDLARAAGARVVATGRSDFPNQINNTLAFPGVFRGVLDVGARDINETMKIAAAYAIAALISDEELTENYIIPDPFDRRVVPAVAEAVALKAKATGVVPE